MLFAEKTGRRKLFLRISCQFYSLGGGPCLCRSPFSFSPPIPFECVTRLLCSFLPPSLQSLPASSSSSFFFPSPLAAKCQVSPQKTLLRVKGRRLGGPERRCPGIEGENTCGFLLRKQCKINTAWFLLKMFNCRIYEDCPFLSSDFCTLSLPFLWRDRSNLRSSGKLCRAM